MQSDLNARYDLWPTMGEVARAKQVFTDEIRRYEDAPALPQDNQACMQSKSAITCALAEVWRQGRIYQRDWAELEHQHAKTQGLQRKRLNLLTSLKAFFRWLRIKLNDLYRRV